MVVNGAFFHSVVIPYNSHADVTDEPKMAGKAILACRPNSHPFVDRTLILDQPVKIGRSVARARTAPNNGVFDCKVLSRNHALIWYNNGKFYLQDTKSSNGTFVNNQRLGKSGEESLPREICSGDIVQFGVDVLENARKVTHGCIVADLKLYLPDGKEAKASPSTGVLNEVGNVAYEDLHQLNHYIQEALQREQMLETKLSSLQKLVQSLRRAADLSWKALIAEDRLLSRVELLENQLQTYSKSIPEDVLRGELRLLQEDKGVYQGLAKDCLQKVLQEKIEAVQKCQTLEQALTSAQTECARYEIVLVHGQDEVSELALKNRLQYNKIVELQSQLHESDEQHKEALARIEADNEELNNEVKRLLTNEVALNEKIQRLEASEKMVGRQLMGIHDHLNALHNQKESADGVICKNIEGTNEKNEKSESDSLKTLLDRLTVSLEEQKQNKELYELIQAQASTLKGDKKEKLDNIAALEDELGLHVEKLLLHKEEHSKLKKSLRLSEEQLGEEGDSLDDTVIDKTIQNGDDDKLDNGGQPLPTLESQQAQITQLRELAINLTVDARYNKCRISLLTEAVKASQSQMEALEETIVLTQIDLNNAKKALAETMTTCVVHDEKLEEAQKSKEVSETSLVMLTEHIKDLETTMINRTIQENAETESEDLNKYKEEIIFLKNQLQEAQQNAKQHKNESEKLKIELRDVIEELREAQSVPDSTIVPDNRAIEELNESRREVQMLKDQIAERIFQLQNPRHEIFFVQSGDELPSTTDYIALTKVTKVLEKKVSQLEEDLLLVKEKYSECNLQKTKLEKRLNELQLDYDAVAHQPYFVSRQHYLLGILVALVVAMLLSMALSSPS